MSHTITICAVVMFQVQLGMVILHVAHVHKTQSRQNSTCKEDEIRIIITIRYKLEVHLMLTMKPFQQSHLPLRMLDSPVQCVALIFSYPLSHLHLKSPGKLWHSAWGPQAGFVALHSFMSK